MEKIINKFYEIEIKNNLVIILIKKDVFELLTTVHDSDLLINTLKSFQSNTKIKALVFVNTPECYGEKVYDHFVKEIMLSFEEEDDCGMPDFWDKNVRFREIHILNRFVSFLANYNKLVFMAISGSVVTPFFGASLATDIRYATPGTYFSLAHNKYGLHPSGGLPYFLTQQLGYNKAMELMLSEKISAKKALELGLINKIVPSEIFLELVIKEIEKITQYRSCTLLRTKLLSKYAHNSLSDYFAYEGSKLNL